MTQTIKSNILPMSSAFQNWGLRFVEEGVCEVARSPVVIAVNFNVALRKFSSNILPFHIALDNNTVRPAKGKLKPTGRLRCGCTQKVS